MTDPHRLLPTEPRLRATASDLLSLTEHLPILSPHGHVSATDLAANRPFPDPAELLVTGDHYLTRLLHAAGVPLGQLGVGGHPADPREVWRTVASHWHLFAGTATGYWLTEELAEVFQIDTPLTADSADEVYDRLAIQLTTEAFLPRSLFRQFQIEVLATTDDPLDDLTPHRTLQHDGYRVLPTFRPDRYIDPTVTGFTENVTGLLATVQQPTTFDGYLNALRDRRQYFIDHGAVSADHGVLDPATADLDPAEAHSLFQRILRGDATDDDLQLFRAHMLLQMAAMSVDDGLVMTLHPGVFRNHSSATLHHYGPDTGHDIPVRTTFVEGLRPVLERFGLAPGFQLILFTVDETTYSREIAPLAGFYPSVLIGAPWWFLDAPDAIARFRSAVTETAGFYRGSGFIDDTRAFLSIPARHNTARRVDAGFMARLVAQGRITMPQAERIAVDLVDAIPRKAFKL
ncbi:MAG TPA: glucuronate isomerase [Microbacterium sp.]|nr:glucuronate isomerase [Microbacterium sp.]